MTRIVYYDLETTGLSDENDEIIEIAGKDNCGNTFSKLVNPQCEISEKMFFWIFGVNRNVSFDLLEKFKKV